MDRVGVFVDAGYLFAAGSILLHGEKLPRSRLDLDLSRVTRQLIELAEDRTGLPLLRLYWYDGTSEGPTAQHVALGFQDHVKVRLGLVNRFGEQKGVDSLVVTDMINLARNNALASALLLSGDEDIRVGVQQAQEAGVCVHLLGIEPHRDNQSNLLIQEADAVHELKRADVEQFLRIRPDHARAIVSLPDEASASQIVAEVAKAIASGLQLDIRDSLATEFADGEWKIPSDVDRHLLRTLEENLGRRPDEDEKRSLRDCFKRTIQSLSQ